MVHYVGLYYRTSYNYTYMDSALDIHYLEQAEVLQEMVWRSISAISWFPIEIPKNRMELLESIGDYLRGRTSYYICSVDYTDGKLKLKKSKGMGS